MFGDNILPPLYSTSAGLIMDETDEVASFVECGALGVDKVDDITSSTSVPLPAEDK